MTLPLRTGSGLACQPGEVDTLELGLVGGCGEVVEAEEGKGDRKAVTVFLSIMSEF
jgi:hypothetical protein